MTQALFFIAFLSCLSGSFAPQICSNKPDGTIVSTGCLAYTKCEQHKSVITTCPIGEVVDLVKKKCDLPSKVPPPCGLTENCTTLKNSKYPDLKRKCQYYFTCYEHKFMGFNPCPGNTVFDTILQVCAYPANVLPPCGTKSKSL